MPLKRHSQSEELIHFELARRAELLMKDALQNWKKRRKIEPYAATWPSEPIKDDGGQDLTQCVLCPLSASTDTAQRLGLLQQLVERTKAYGLVVVEQRENAIHILFETRHGARSWRIPLAWHGDIQIPGQVEMHDNDECVGLLWREGRKH